MDQDESPLDALPVDVLPHLTRMLTGWDLVRLSQVNRRLFTELLPSNSDVWRERLPAQHPEPSPSSSWKQIYCSCSSRRFLGSEIVEEDVESDVHGCYLDAPEMIMDTWSIEPFSIDIWFAISRTKSQEPNSYVGGILLGAQSENPQEQFEPDMHRAFIYVNQDCDLYCSVTNDQHLVAVNLPCDEWHHLTLTIEHLSNGNVAQCVYVDGEKVHESNGSGLFTDWDDLHYFQLGTGCLSPLLPGILPDYPGWYTFNGLIDDCRFLNNTLTPDQVKRLAVEHADLSEEAGGCEWSMKINGSGSVRFVICTRPRERVCELQIPRNAGSSD